MYATDLMLNIDILDHHCTNKKTCVHDLFPCRLCLYIVSIWALTCSTMHKHPLLCHASYMAFYCVCMHVCA